MRAAKVGTKIAAGFGFLLVLTAGLAAFTMVRIASVSDKSERLANEYVPEVKASNHFADQAQATMLAMRSYGFTFDQKFYDEGQKSFALAKDALKEAADLSAKLPHLVKLKEAVDSLNRLVGEFETFSAQTSSKVAEIGKLREVMGRAVGDFMDWAEKLLKSQRAIQDKEFDRQLTPEELLERAKKVALITEAIQVGSNQRIANFRAQALRDPKILRESLKGFDKIDSLLAEAKSLMQQQSNIAQVEEVAKAAQSYKSAMMSLADEWEELEEINVSRARAGEEMLRIAGTVDEAGLEHTINGATESYQELTATEKVLVGCGDCGSNCRHCRGLEYRSQYHPPLEEGGRFA